MDKLRLFFFFEFSNRDIGFLLNDMFNGFSLMIGYRDRSPCFLHFLVLGNLIAEISSLFESLPLV